MAHRCRLDADGLDGFTPLDVVVKLAFGEQREALRNEYRTYRFLRSNGVVKGITTVLGFFDDCEGGPSALVMLYAGVQLERVLSVSEWWVLWYKMNARARGLISENVAKQL